jgi:hypothetical protein
MAANEAPDRCGIGLGRSQMGDAKRHLIARVAPIHIGDMAVDTKGLPGV